MSYASESGHWYKRDGTTCYTLTGKNGKTRNTTLRDARKLELVPSVTEIMKVMAKPGLERWKQEQVKLSALTLPRIKGETLDEFSRRIDSDASKQALDAQKLGTGIHGAIERYFQGQEVKEHKKIVEQLIIVLRDEFGDQKWSSEKSFSHHFGFGGKVDIHSNEWVIDFKTKDFKKEDMKRKFTITDNLIQLSAYKLGLKVNNAKLANIFISRTETGLIKVEKHEKELNFLFVTLLNFWKKLKEYDSGYTQDNMEPQQEVNLNDCRKKRKQIK